MFLIDTSFIIELFRRPSNVERFFDKIEEEGAKTTVISVYEVFRRRSRMSKTEAAAFTRFFRSIEVLPIDPHSAERAAEIYEKLEKIGEKISEFDIMILGIMLHNGINKIITRDKDFEKVAKYIDIEVILI
ncbi:MAG: type II toxin-antitoxin system VapC family toxin [Nitrososphaeria archaeon]|nr:type II toxin-antitoxin system VapC family toxin [Nitrososphaeria archaeon]